MENRKCVQCGKEFHISDSEIDFYHEKNFCLPKRCHQCRENNNTKSREHKNSIIRDRGSRNSQLKGINSRRSANITSGILLVVIFLIFGIFYVSSRIEDDYSDYTTQQDTTQSIEASNDLQYLFRSTDQLEEHFIKHGNEFGYETSLEYVMGANGVILSLDAMTKKEAEDGDMIYYLESTNEIVFLSSDGFIRTYFRPEDGIEYYNRQ